ncbi:MAG: universal stress protein, partial [Desulfobacterales bacterium]
VILDYASENDIDLIVMGTHGRRGLEHVFLGSAAEEVVRLAKCPVLTMREIKKPHPKESLNRILVPIDFSHYAHQALLFAKEIAATYKSRLQVLHVIEQSKRPDFYFFNTNPNPNLIQNIRKKSKEKIEQLLNTVKEPNVAADIHIIEGQAARDIVKFADENDTDLVVISSHGLTGYEQLLIGGVAEKVVRMSTSPVFTVKTFGNSKIIS